MPGYQIQYNFSSKPWKYAGPGGWIFISLPKKLSEEIRRTFKSEETGWGRLSVTARIRNTAWKTAIWFDSKADTFILPLKAEIRKKEKVILGQNTDIAVYI